MMVMEPTKGPYRVEKYDDQSSYSIQHLEDGKWKALIHGLSYDNAVFMASSWEMHDALDALLYKHMEYVANDFYMVADQDAAREEALQHPVILQAAAALAKARGET